MKTVLTALLGCIGCVIIYIALCHATKSMKDKNVTKEVDLLIVPLLDSWPSTKMH